MLETSSPIRRHATGRAVLLAALLSVGVLLVATWTRSVPAARAAPDWLDAINAIRTSAGLSPVVVNTDPNAGPTNDDAIAHSKYVVLNNSLTHVEIPGNPGYSTGGAAAGQQGDVSSASSAIDPVAAVQQFMAGGYHFEPILDPRTTAVAFGIYTDPAQQGIVSASTLVFIRHAANPTAPVLWPPDGGTTAAQTYQGGESPNPLASCPNYAPPTGASISAQLLTAPQVTSVSLTMDGAAAPLASCWYDGATVQFSPSDVGVWDGIGRSILNGSNVVVIFPQQVLGNGVYHVTIMNNATTVCAWSFSVGQAAPPANNACGQNGTTPGPQRQQPPAPAVTPPTQQPPTTTGAATFAGTWTVDDFGSGVGGILTLVQTGTQVTGSYSYADPSGCGTENGTLSGTVNAGALTFTTVETGCGAGGGQTGVVQLAADGQSFDGGGTWDGTRTGP